MMSTPSPASLTESRNLSEKACAHQKVLSGLICFVAILAIGLIDYVTGYQISVLVFYAIPIGLATLCAAGGMAPAIVIERM